MFKRVWAAVLVISILGGCSGVQPAALRVPGDEIKGDKHHHRGAHAVPTCAGIALTPEKGNEVAFLGGINGDTNGGKSLLQDAFTYTSLASGPLSGDGIPYPLFRKYAYGVGASFNPATYLAYDAMYQSYATPAPGSTYPITTTDPNGGQDVYEWGPGSFDTTGNTPGDAQVGSDANFLQDTGNVLLMAESQGALSSSWTSSVPSGSGKSTLQRAYDNLAYMIQPAQVQAAWADYKDTNRIFRYADGYFLMGDALLQDGFGDASTECKAIEYGAAFLSRGLAIGSNNVESIYETFPETSGRNPCPSATGTDPANCFDSSYQAVSLRLLITFYLMMPSSGITNLSVTIPGQVAQNITIAPSDVLTAITQGMNQEQRAIDFIGASSTHTPVAPYDWCYTPNSGESGFQNGEISECANARVYDSTYMISKPLSDPEMTFGAADAAVAIQLYGYLNLSSAGVWHSIADQVSTYYTTCAFQANGDCSSNDPAQRFDI